MTLLHVRNTLEDLTISTRLNPGNDLKNPELDLAGSLKVLIVFPCLETLEISWPSLAASFVPATSIPFKYIIPRHIRTLNFTDDMADQKHAHWDDEALYNMIAQWLQDQMVLKPNLQNVSIYLDQTRKYWALV
jgi:hypothetical protein